MIRYCPDSTHGVSTAFHTELRMRHLNTKMLVDSVQIQPPCMPVFAREGFAAMTHNSVSFPALLLVNQAPDQRPMPLSKTTVRLKRNKTAKSMKIKQSSPPLPCVQHTTLPGIIFLLLKCSSSEQFKNTAVPWFTNRSDPQNFASVGELCTGSLTPPWPVPPGPWTELSGWPETPL